MGGSLTHFRWVIGGTTFDWLRPATPDDLCAGSADRLASFPLVPFSNRIRDGCFGFEGRAIRLLPNRRPHPHAMHGHGWQAAWEVIDERADRVSLAYERSAGDWPFPYRARQDIALDEDELRMTLAVENRGSVAMPVGLGWHPYFRRTSDASLHARVAAMWATDTEVMPTTLVAADARLARAQGLRVASTALDNVFTGWQHEATIVWPEWNAQLAMAAETPIDFLVVYCPPRADFFCAEPVSHCTDAFNLAAEGRTDTGMRTLAPGERLQATLRLRPTVAGLQGTKQRRAFLR